MSDHSSHHVDIDPLRGADIYPVWKIKMLDILTDLSLDDYIDANVGEPAEASAKAAWQKADRHLNMKSLKHLKDHEMVRGMETAAEVDDDPKTLAQARAAHDANQFEAAMVAEKEQLERLGTWELVELPKNRKAIASLWVYKPLASDERDVVAELTDAVLQLAAVELKETWKSAQTFKLENHTLIDTPCSGLQTSVSVMSVETSMGQRNPCIHRADVHPPLDQGPLISQALRLPQPHPIPSLRWRMLMPVLLSQAHGTRGHCTLDPAEEALSLRGTAVPRDQRLTLIAPVELSKVTKALGSIIQIAGDNVLPIAAEAFSVLPIPALAPATKILDSIWKAVSAVKTNRSACLRLTDRCASLLISIQEEVARSGDAVADELKAPLEKLEQFSSVLLRSFSDIERFFQDQAEWSFIHLYVKRDDILRDIVRHNESVNDCITLFHMGVNLRNLAFTKRILEQLVTPQQVSLLFAQDETNPPSPLIIDEADPEDLRLRNFPAGGSSETLQDDDLSSLSDKLLHMQQIENEADRARDIDELRHVLRSALDAPDNRTVSRILQIPSPDMPAPTLMTALLRELERQQHELPTSTGGSSPSPRIRTLTWPVDGTPARQVALLDRQFVEVALDVLKRATQNDPSTSRPVVLGAFKRVRTDIHVEPPSTSNSAASSASAFWSGGTEITTPLSTDTGLPTSDDPYADSRMPDDRPIDPQKAATEIRYRMSLSHAFEHLSVTLPLWTPSLVEIGAVGYLVKPTGAFRTLFNCRNPAATSNGRISDIAELPIVPTVIQKHSTNRDLQTRGIKFIDKLKPGPSPVVKRNYAISALGETAHLIAEKVEHQYFEHLDVLKKWFRANVQAIVEAYHPECLREELFLVVGTLNARDHALFVNHGSDNPEEAFETQFHVLSSRQPGEAWGYFKPFPMEGTDGATQRICKVSNIGSSRSTVLLSRLRFRPDELDPTTH
ncbi:hypothetical protein GGX14DRAFT_588248 [Mycena pura]|uniref:Uncharacterized protein n=1 Tax=Mycena pura TaxID=153505 RepID=A0AAD6UWK8_9AGAR|nr:hypothetical protein GGX14DRAFT_588248 [Mycena pura]